jgi:hypothetical protein
MLEIRKIYNLYLKVKNKVPTPKPKRAKRGAKQDKHKALAKIPLKIPKILPAAPRLKLGKIFIFSSFFL